MKNFEFNKEGHYYTLDNKRLYGVTNVLGVIAKPALIQWSANQAVEYIKSNSYGFQEIDGKKTNFYGGVDDGLLEKARYAHRKKKEKAGDIGTEAHGIIEGLIKVSLNMTDGRIADYVLFKENVDEKTKQMVNNFLSWANKNNVQFLASEKQVYSENMWVAGTTDMVFIKDSKKYVGDIKTSSAIYPEHFYQMAAYRMMLEEMGEIDFEGSIVIRLGKDGNFNEDKDVQFRYDFETDKAAFLGALAIFKAGESYK